MPFSSESGKAFIRAVVADIASKIDHSPFNVLDVGAGSGGYLARYSDLLPSHMCRWYAIEAWQPYLREYELEERYHRVFCTDVRQYVRCLSYPGYPQHVGICFLGDIVEHMSKEDALLVIQELLKVSTTVIISIPIVHWPQDAYAGNPYERHIKDDWSHEEAIASFPSIKGWAIENEIGVYVLGK